MELLLLETFQWNLYLPTAAHFIEYYLPVAVNETDLHDGWPMTCMEKTMLYMSKYADYFLEVSLQGTEFNWDAVHFHLLNVCVSVYELHTESECFCCFVWIKKHFLSLSRPCVSQIRPFPGCCGVCGLLPSNLASVSDMASAPPASVGVHLGTAAALRGETSNVSLYNLNVCTSLPNACKCKLNGCIRNFNWINSSCIYMHSVKLYLHSFRLHLLAFKLSFHLSWMHLNAILFMHIQTLRNATWIDGYVTLLNASKC